MIMYCNNCKKEFEENQILSVFNGEEDEELCPFCKSIDIIDKDSILSEVDQILEYSIE